MWTSRRNIWDASATPSGIKRELYVCMRSSMAPRSVRFGLRSQKLSNVGQSLDGWSKIYYLELLCILEGTLSRWSRLHLQSTHQSAKGSRGGLWPVLLMCIKKACASPVGTLIGLWWWYINNHIYQMYLPRSEWYFWWMTIQRAAHKCAQPSGFWVDWRIFTHNGPYDENFDEVRMDLTS
jgi:hypothetical protein